MNLKPGISLIVASVALSACAPSASAPVAEQPSAAADASVSPAPIAPAAEVANADPALLTTEQKGTLSTDQVKAAVLPVTQFSGLAIAQENLRHQILQRAAWDGKKPVQLDWSVNAVSADTAVMIAQAKVGDTTHYATIVYDALSNRAYNENALIEPGKWADFTSAVKAADGGAAAAEKLAAESFPFGESRAFAFSKDGGLALMGDKPVVLNSDVIAPVLTPLGQRALQGVRSPARLSAAPAPSAPTPGSTGTDVPNSQRPRITLGPDCQKLKCVALTFDDGPAPETPEMLEVLRAKGVPVTFFTLGNNVKQNSAVVRKAAALGNQIGWHTTTHGDLSRMSKERATKEIADGATTLTELSGAAPMVFRPPYGSHNKHVDELIGGHKMADILWNVDTRDWDKSKIQGEALTQAVISSAVNGARPGGIILMHDIHPTSRAAAGPVVDKLKGMGFTLVTVTELPGWENFAWGHNYCAAPGAGSGC